MSDEACTLFRELIVDDDPAARERARQHAAACPGCRRLLEADERVAALVARWKMSTPGPADDLGERLLAAVRQEIAQHGPAPRRGRLLHFPHPSTWSGPTWAAAGALAATLAIASMLAVRAMTFAPAPAVADKLLVADALREAEAAEREHARAIARLEQTVRPILARAGDPAVPAPRAARLLAFRERLRFLDETIAEIHGFLDENPANSGARTILLAAYNEKTDVLRQLIAFDQENGS